MAGYSLRADPDRLKNRARLTRSFSVLMREQDDLLNRPNSVADRADHNRVVIGCSNRRSGLARRSITVLPTSLTPCAPSHLRSAFNRLRKK
ncbi:hypothetical protein MPL3365_140209 [Mesorhizobium plurifarium]|uniref:Uncharacterized protein n=1 Tax=Mesorhizobium plurifarium TaxID=69974 RepID=A0A090G4J7_MESPL|nr:hypothetical protein MPL3365_140209 [Mesorhizobium plurifarium]